MRTLFTWRTRRDLRTRFTSLLALGATSLLLVTGLTTLSAASASATSARPCSESVSTAPGVAVTTAAGVLIVGVQAGTTQITVNCNVSAGAAYAIEASLLGGIGTTAVVPSNEADLATSATFATSSTSVACPAATAGQCASAIFQVPASFGAGDSNAACAPTSAQIDAGLFACVVAVVNASTAPIPGGEFLISYAGQSTPSAPTISATPASGGTGATLTLSDAPGNTKYWFGNAVQAVQAATLGTTPTPAPASCSATAGYGDVPVAFLSVHYLAVGSTTAVAGSATGVKISNACYDGKTLNAPVLSGTVTVPTGLVAGTHYDVYLCELNATIYPSNDANVATDCGAAPAGASWIDASFPFVASAGTLTQAAPLTGTSSVSASAAFVATLSVTGNTGVVTFNQTTGQSSLVVSSTGVVSTKKSLNPGSYVVSGTTSDPAGDNGVFSYTLSVGAILQSTSATGSVQVLGSKNFSLQLATTGNVGAVTFAKTAGSPSLLVSSSGLITTTGSLAVGSYQVSGTTADATGDVGTFTFTLAVSASPKVFAVRSVVGHVVTGRTVTITILGAGFYGQPRVTSHPGTSARVIRDTGNSLSVRVYAASGSRAGTYTFTVTLKNGKAGRVRYVQVN